LANPDYSDGIRVNRLGQLAIGIYNIWNAGEEKIPSGPIKKRNASLLEDRLQALIQDPQKD
jgi:hypothetical protein